MKKKVFFVHPSALDDGSQDASANPALQMVENEVKRNKKGEPKFYVLLSPKKADNPFSQFHPDRMQILDQAYRLGLTPKKYTLFEPVHPTEPKESFIECSSALLLQFVNGGDLLNFLCDHLELSFDEKLDLALQALRLVIQLHDNQIAHLDLKPENFLVYIREGRYELKLADFGFAKNAKNGDNTTTDRCYSPGYMPPEFAQSYWIQKKWRIDYKFLPLDGAPLPIFKLDEWSLGATLFFILFGSRYEKSLAQNFQGHAPLETIEAFIAYKQSLSDRMVRGFCASFAPKVAQLLIGLLQYDPEKRLSAKESLENFTKS
jgi:serine/threonine protein kinase